MIESAEQEPIKQEHQDEGISTLLQTIVSLAPAYCEHSLVAAYQQLKIESIAEALQSMRFAVGPRCKILAVSLNACLELYL
ncbi:unnamed protein product [Gongylonema pulchrum]|uniref:CSTF2_hinge domain-containing protein n=1 Tax=Gongylonema pulchrum TaxID=637853 RepID=A0A183DGW2_9BILA|nr:unnamed protein product [Gongylonema pulchrum]